MGTEVWISYSCVTNFSPLNLFFSTMQEYKHYFSSQAIQKQAAGSVWPANCRFAHLSIKFNSVSVSQIISLGLEHCCPCRVLWSEVWDISLCSHLRLCIKYTGILKVLRNPVDLLNFVLTVFWLYYYLDDQWMPVKILKDAGVQQIKSENDTRPIELNYT